MSSMEPEPTTVVSVDRGLLEYTNWIYGLHALSVVIGLLTAHAVAMRFAFGLPSIIAVIMNYARRADARGTWLESHFRWQIRTFWYSWLWILLTAIVAGLLLIILVGFVIAMVGFALIGLWVIYRVARGWLALREGRPMPMPLPMSASMPPL
jgi:uncharacterized membrane protein